MEDRRKDLVRRSEMALTSLQAMRSYLLPKENKSKKDYDIIDILNTTIAVFEEMREEWLLSIGNPQTISNDTVAKVLEMVSKIIKERAAQNGRL